MECDMESGQLSDIIPEPTPEEIEAARLAEEKRLAEEAEAQRVEDERRARVAEQTPRIIKLMRQRWGGNTDEAIDAAWAGFEPEAYQSALESFQTEIATYTAQNRSRSGAMLAPGGIMPPVEQPKAHRKGRR